MHSKLKNLSVAATATAFLAFSQFAHAEISGDVVRIGFITDMSGGFADPDGPGGAHAIRMAIADFGGTMNGKSIELLTFDHQNKADNAASKSREWFDQQGIDVLIGGTNSAASLAMAKIAAEKKKPFIAIGSGSARLTNEECSPYTVHYAYDTVALARGTGSALFKQGGKSWYFLTADYAFGKSLESEAAKIVKETGGTITGTIKHPIATSDFSSFLLQAQNSKAQVLGLANAGDDTVNAVKSAYEFGINKSMKLAALIFTINDIHALTLPIAKDMYLTDHWYWDMNPETRKWAQRYFGKMKKMPSSFQAADYSAVTQYLVAVKATATDNPDKVLAYLKSAKLNDLYVKNGYIRADGRMMNNLYLMQVKAPAESKYPWDYYKIVETIPSEKVYTTKAESKCALWK
ncbi:ABC transporter substrate-binding protein [Noviherbaspirillum sedimenti]|uniref:ABC transporter substrate-binding protein n=1 Tax=Noviherbaspirillum sedimenti TaxID=2320865 RepID=A0A3A3G1N0_9BURK|nr:ABC transporter substrate-binding protein [Noviherbaspirillum sedimenti]RJG00382.1 ABC transporter substrate-binding protein [Noviherbaspirillum sedimenti]